MMVGIYYVNYMVVSRKTYSPMKRTKKVKELRRLLQLLLIEDSDRDLHVGQCEVHKPLTLPGYCQRCNSQVCGL